MSVSENAARQVRATDHSIVRCFILLINQLIRIDFFYSRRYLSNAVAVQSQIVHALISFVKYIFFKLG